MASQVMQKPNGSAAVVASLVAGSIAGTVDIFAAALINRVSPAIILESVSSGIYGLAAYSGTHMILVGLALQLAMSVVIAAVYVAAALRWQGLVRRPVLWGLGYGLVVFLVMNMIVVPLSAFAPRPTHISAAWFVLNVIAMLAFGIIVSILVSRELGSRATHQPGS